MDRVNWKLGAGRRVLPATGAAASPTPNGTEDFDFGDDLAA
jgi:hypothetical protein